MARTPRNKIPLQDPGSLTTDALFNEFTGIVDFWLNCVVLEVGRTAPTGTEVEGDCVIVGTPATGVYTGHENEGGILLGGTWQFYAPPAAGVPIIKNLDDGNDYECSEAGVWSIKTAGAPVASVNGQTGVVVLDASDVGAATAAQGTTADAAQVGIQFTDETTNVGGLGTVAAIDFAGAGVTATFSSGVLTVTIPGGGSTTLAALTDVDLTGLADGDMLVWDSGAGDWVPATPGGGGGSPGGATTEVQFNNGGAFDGDSTFTWDDTAKRMNAPVIDFAKATDIARAATTSIGAATGNFVHLTGTTTITSFGTGTAGMTRYIRFAGAGTLTHNATSLILPGAANITTAANDTCIAVSEGSSNWRVIAYERASGQPLASAAITGFAATLNTSSPNNTINVSRLAVSGGSTNVDVAIVPKGTGALMAALPDNASTGGNKRGQYAIDWQLYRISATDVASGDYSSCIGAACKAAGTYSTAYGYGAAADGTGAIAHGYGAQAGGSYGGSIAIGQSANAISADGGSTAVGQGTDATGNSASAFGLNASASGQSAVAIGLSATASGYGSCSIGQNANDQGRNGLLVNKHAGFSGTTGKTQQVVWLGATETTNATPRRVAWDGSGGTSAAEFFSLPTDTAAIMRVQVLARQTAGSGAGAVDAWVGDVLVANIGGTTAITGSATLTHIGASAFTVAVSADNTLDGLAVDVTGAASKTIVWSVRMSGIEG